MNTTFFASNLSAEHQVDQPSNPSPRSSVVLLFAFLLVFAGSVAGSASDNDPVLTDSSKATADPIWVDAPNIDYIGFGYNIVKMDPYNLSSQTQGLIFDMTCTKKAPGTSYPQWDLPGLKVPPGVTLNRTPKLTSDTVSTFMKTASDYQKTSEDHVSAEVGVPDVFSFSESASFKDYTDTSTSLETFRSYTHKIRTSYKAYFENAVGDKMKLSSGFAECVQALPVQYDKDIYLNFILGGEVGGGCNPTKGFGTHFADQITMGGISFMTVSFEASTYDKITATGYTVSGGASATYDGMTGGGSAGHNEEERKAFTNATQVTKSSVTQYGGTPDDDFKNWAPTVDNNPIPTKVALKPLWEVLTTQHFQDGDIKAKQQNLQQAITTYIKENSPDAFNFGDAVSVYEYTYDDSRSAFPTYIQYYTRAYSTQLPGHNSEMYIDDLRFVFKRFAFLAFDKKITSPFQTSVLNGIHANGIYGSGRCTTPPDCRCHQGANRGLGINGHAWKNATVETEDSFYAPQSAYGMVNIPVTQYQKRVDGFPQCGSPNQGWGFNNFAYFTDRSAEEETGWEKMDPFFYAISPKVEIPKK